MTAAAVLLAPAKLTWFLEVTGVRDDGYHELRSEMVSVNLFDELEVIDDGGELLTLVPESDGPPVSINDEDNLVRRALRLVGRRASVRILKRIPLGGGLGGGSSDAGAILRWAGVAEVASAVGLGGDVPFCVHGGRALVEGIGERVQQLPFERRAITLIVAPFGVDTSACYRSFDEMFAEGWRPEGRNHLLEPAQRTEPRLRTLCEWAAQETGRQIELCGSGSTLFVEGHHRPGVDLWSVDSPVGRVRFIEVTTVAEQPS